MTEPSDREPETTSSRTAALEGAAGRSLPPAAALLAVGVALLALLAALGSRWGIWSPQTGFGLLRFAGYGAVVALLLGAAGLVLSRRAGSRGGTLWSAVAVLVALLLVAVPLYWRHRARQAPPIHDITTDTDDPPRFDALAPLRADAPNPTEYAGPQVAAQQRQAYPDIRPVLLELSYDRAFQRALDGVETMGWEIVSADPGAGRIEATDTTFWFGFRDDIVVRLTPVDRNRTVVDVRSVSRVGRGDAGTNARRVRSYLDELGG